MTKQLDLFDSKRSDDRKVRNMDAVLDNESEKRKPIFNFEGLYEVSNLGRIRSAIDRKGSFNGKILIPRKDKNGYLLINLRKFKVCFTKKVHGVVAQSFLGQRPAKMVINHKDSIKANNRVENLEYVTQRENIRHCRRHGIMRDWFGEGSPSAKLTNSNVLEIRKLLYVGIPTPQIAMQFGVKVSTIKNIKYGSQWKRIS